MYNLNGIVKDVVKVVKVKVINTKLKTTVAICNVIMQ